jgi:hypothetical protein
MVKNILKTSINLKLKIMKLESLKKFEKNAVNKVEMSSLLGGRLAVGFATAGAKEVCTFLGCGSYSSDWNDDGVITLIGFTSIEKPCN